MRKKFELDSSEEYYWKEFVKYNRVKYFFLFIIGLFSGISLMAFIYLTMGG